MAQEAQVPARILVEQFDELRETARRTLTESADALDQHVDLDEELSAVARDLPRFDVHAAGLELEPPWWTRASANLLRTWIGQRVREAFGDPVDKALRAYGHVLQSWATEMLTRLRRTVDAHAQPMAEALDQMTLPTSGTTLDEAGIRDDVNWLTTESEQESMSMSTSAR
jgi:hypothetical protein